MKGSGLSLSLNEKDPIKVNGAIQQLMEGRSNAVGTFTLTANDTTTTVASTTCGPNSIIVWMPTTLHAAGQMTTMYITTIGAGTFTLTHANTADTDKIFNYLAIG